MIEEELIVLLGKETGLAIVSALDDMDRNSSPLEGARRGMITASTPCFYNAFKGGCPLGLPFVALFFTFSSCSVS
jgi:hypothetical protein